MLSAEAGVWLALTLWQSMLQRLSRHQQPAGQMCMPAACNLMCDGVNCPAGCSLSPSLSLRSLLPHSHMPYGQHNLL